MKYNVILLDDDCIFLEEKKCVDKKSDEIIEVKATSGNKKTAEIIETIDLCSPLPTKCDVLSEITNDAKIISVSPSKSDSFDKKSDNTSDYCYLSDSKSPEIDLSGFLPNINDYDFKNTDNNDKTGTNSQQSCNNLTSSLVNSNKKSKDLFNNALKRKHEESRFLQQKKFINDNTKQSIDHQLAQNSKPVITTSASTPEIQSILNIKNNLINIIKSTSLNGISQLDNNNQTASQISSSTSSISQNVTTTSFSTNSTTTTSMRCGPFNCLTTGSQLNLTPSNVNLSQSQIIATQSSNVQSSQSQLVIAQLSQPQAPLVQYQIIPKPLQPHVSYIQRSQSQTPLVQLLHNPLFTSQSSQSFLQSSQSEIITQSSQHQYLNVQPIQYQSLQSNTTVYKYSRSIPSIVVESGSILNSKCSVIINSIGVDANKRANFLGNLAKQIINSGGNSLRKQLESITPVTYNQADKTYSIIKTDSGDLLINTTNINTILHVHLMFFNYFNDASEIHFKNTVSNILEFAIKHNFSSIAFPALGCGSLLYPASFVAKWFDEVFQSFFMSYTCHSLNLVKIVLFENDEIIKQQFKNYYGLKETALTRLICKFF